MAKKDIVRILQSQGFGSRKDCSKFVKNYGLIVNGEEIFDPKLKFETKGLEFEIFSKTWTYREKVYLLLNKPAQTECSRTPLHNPSVLGRFPTPLIERGINTVGRLDADTTGAILLTDDGQFNHKITSPKHKVPKIYEVTCRHTISAEAIEKLKSGVLLKDEEETVAAEEVIAIDEHTIHMTLIQGKYHQVKRMLAAVSNRVEKLHRLSVGKFDVKDLELGEWRYLSEEEIHEFS